MFARFNPFRWGDRAKDRETPTDEGRPLAPGDVAWALEPRFMFDAAGVASGAELAEQQAAEDAVAESGAGAEETGADDVAEVAAVFESYLPPAENNEIVFIDGAVENYDEMLAGIDPQAEIVVIHPDGNGLQQIADVLSERSGLDAIHVISHGDEGLLELGSLTLSSENLNDFTAVLGEIGEALSAEGDILFYGCALGGGTGGEGFLAELSALTGADVAGSLAIAS